jgi:hypothetical protein
VKRAGSALKFDHEEGVRTLASIKQAPLKA